MGGLQHDGGTARHSPPPPFPIPTVAAVASLSVASAFFLPQVLWCGGKSERARGPALEQAIIYPQPLVLTKYSSSIPTTQTGLPSAQVVQRRDNARRQTIVALTSNDLKNGLNIEVDGTPMRVRDWGCFGGRVCVCVTVVVILCIDVKYQDAIDEFQGDHEACVWGADLCVPSCPSCTTKWRKGGTSSSSCVQM